ncbi:DNA-processing protein DprA [Candidatus Hydrogenedentota bacterium]
MTENERTNWFALSLIDGIGPRTFGLILSRCEEVGITLDDLFAGSDDELRQTLDLPERVLKLLSARNAARDHALKYLQTFAMNNVKVITWKDDTYPFRLSRNPDSSSVPVLCANGDPACLNMRTVAIVGTREPTRAGERFGVALGRALGKRGVTVVSGYARGADSAGHRGALKVGAATAAILPTGIFRTAATWGLTSDDGDICFVSQFPPNQEWVRQGALARNRTICALSDAVFVIEPRRDGGAMHAAGQAIELSVPLFVLPGPKSRPPEDLTRRFPGVEIVDRDAKPADIAARLAKLARKSAARKEHEQLTFPFTRS